MSKLIDINTLNKNNDYINDNINARLINNASKNLLDYDKWIGTSIVGGTGIYENYGITLTATINDCYTRYTLDENHRIPVKENEQYVFTWDINTSKTSGSSSLSNSYCYVFFYTSQSTTFVSNIFVRADKKGLSFTIPSNCNYMNFRVGVSNSGDTIAYENLMIRRAEISDDTFEPYYRTQKQLDTDLSTVENNIIEIKDYIGYTDNDIYGLEVDYENSLFTRLAAAVGKSGGSDFNNTNAWGNRKRCNLTDNGVVTAYYGDEAYTETGALTQAVTVNGVEYPVGTAVQVMVEQPKFYYRVVPLKLEPYTTQNGDIGYHIRKARYYISDTPKNGFKLHPAFIRNGAEKEKIYLSAYEGSLYDVSESSYITDDAQVADFNVDKLSSIANVKPISGLSQNLTRTNTRKLAQNRGTGWEQMYIHTVSASQLLFMVEYGTLNSQQAIGNGVVSKASGTGNESENTGSTSSLGNTSGSVANSEVSYRGEENFWGNIWKWEDGVNILNPNPFNSGEYGKVYVSDNTFTDDIDTLPYEDTNIYPCKTSGGYISAFGYNEKYDWLFIPTEVNGNSAVPVGDMLWNNNIGWRVAVLSGAWNKGSNAGAFSPDLNSASSTRGRSVGGRLVYIPDADESNRNLKQIDKDLSDVENGYIPNAGNNTTGGFDVQRSNGISFTTSDESGITLHSDASIGLISANGVDINTNNLNVTLTDDIEIDCGGHIDIYVNKSDFDIYNVDTFLVESMNKYSYGETTNNYQISLDYDAWFVQKVSKSMKFIYRTTHDTNENLVATEVNIGNDAVYGNYLIDDGKEILPYCTFKRNEHINNIPYKICFNDGIETDILYDIHDNTPELIENNEYELLITHNQNYTGGLTLPDYSNVTIKPDKNVISASFNISNEINLFACGDYAFITLENIEFNNLDTSSNCYIFASGVNNASTIVIKNCTFNNITSLFMDNANGNKCPANLIIENCTFNLNTPWEIYGATSYNHKLIFNNNVITNSGIIIKLSNTPNTGYEGIISNNAGNLTFSGTGTGKIKAWNNVATYTTY